MLKFFVHVLCIAIVIIVAMPSSVPAQAEAASPCAVASQLGSIGICDGEAVGEPTFSNKPALVLNGEGQYARSAAMALDVNKDFTVSTTVSFTNLEDTQTMLSQDGVHVSGFSLQKTGDNHFAFTIVPRDDSDAVDTAAHAYSMTLASADRWYTVTGVKTGHVLLMYVNGKYEGSALLQTTFSAPGPLIIGRGRFNEPTDFIHGAIGRTAVWQRALSASEIEPLVSPQ